MEWVTLFITKKKKKSQCILKDIYAWSCHNLTTILSLKMHEMAKCKFLPLFVIFLHITQPFIAQIFWMWSGAMFTALKTLFWWKLKVKVFFIVIYKVLCTKYSDDLEFFFTHCYDCVHSSNSVILCSSAWNGVKVFCICMLINLQILNHCRLFSYKVIWIIKWLLKASVESCMKLVLPT